MEQVPQSVILRCDLITPRRKLPESCDTDNGDFVPGAVMGRGSNSPQKKINDLAFYNVMIVQSYVGNNSRIT